MAIQTTGQTLAGIEKVMKELYLPAWKNMVNLEITPLMTDVIHNDAVGKSIISAVEFGIGNDSYRQIYEEIKSLFCNIEITDKSITQAQKGIIAFLGNL